MLSASQIYRKTINTRGNNRIRSLNRRDHVTVQVPLNYSIKNRISNEPCRQRSTDSKKQTKYLTCSSFVFIKLSLTRFAKRNGRLLSCYENESSGVCFVNGIKHGASLQEINTRSLVLERKEEIEGATESDRV